MHRLPSLALLATLMALAPAGAGAQEAWVLVDGREVVSVPSGKRIAVSPERSFGSAIDIVRDRDGSLLVLRRDGIHRLTADGELTALAPLDKRKRQEHLAVLPDGRYLVWRHDAFAIWDGKAWKVTTREAISDSVNAIYGVFLAGDALWVVTARKVFMREGDRWIGMEPGYHGDPQHVFPAGAKNKLGEIMVPHINALTFWQPKPSARPGFDKVDLTAFGLKGVPFAAFSKIAPLPDGGALLYGVAPCQFVAVPKNGKPWSFEPVRATKESCRPYVRDLAVGARGRIWAATETGLFTYTKDGKPERNAQPIVQGRTGAVVLNGGSQ